MNYGEPTHLWDDIGARFIPTTVDLADQHRRQSLVQRGRMGHFDSLKALARIYNITRWETDRVLIEDRRPVGAVR